MQIDSNARIVRLSVGELASFRNSGPPATEHLGNNRWRASVGQQWHQTIADRARTASENAQFEVSLSGTWQANRWTFEISGRIDQVILESDKARIVEVKTIRHSLPLPIEELQVQYPEYFAQTATYLALSRLLPQYAKTSLQAELLFIDIETGALQKVHLDAEKEALFETQITSLIPFLEDRRDAQQRLQSLTVTPAFSELREGQAELFKALSNATLEAKHVILEAPTGFGKTGIVLEHTLKQLRDGVFERCIYLTSKSTGQIETIAQLSRMAGKSIRYLQMRNRREHSIDSPQHSCSEGTRCNADLGQKWRESDIRPVDLFKDNTVSLERVKELGKETGICPYHLSKACLPYAELWVGDTNYVFSPSSQNVFKNPYGFESKRTLLIIDEAHNLPDRVADALSVGINATDLIFSLEVLADSGAPKKLLSVGREFTHYLNTQKATEVLPTNEAYKLLDICEDFSQLLQDAHFDYEQMPPFALECIWSIPDLANRLSEPAHEWLFWCPTEGAVKATCLNPSQWIAECLKPFGGSILMSATLSPVQNFHEMCGLEKKEITIAIGQASWRTNAYNVAIDTRVDTRLSQRKNHYETTAQTISALASHSPGKPIAVFFASYQYAENIKTYLEVVDPILRVSLQPRGVDLENQEAFIDEGLLMADVLFLILGSGYAEGLDKLGGKVDTAMIVGPALSEINAVHTAKVEADLSMNREIAFRNVSIIPAMRRIHQALGRIVRAPEHNARVLLHGKRYAQTAYFDQLAPEYQTRTLLKNDRDLTNWLEKSAFQRS